MVMHRRRLLESGKAKPLYQLDQGTVTGSGSTRLTVTGNHVKFNNLYSQAFSLKPLGVGNNYINNQPVWFTVPAHTQCQLKILNITATNAGTIAVNFRKANTSYSGSFGTGNFNAGTTPEKIVTVNITQNESEGALFVYPSASRTTVIEFDVEFWVGDERWI